MADLLFRETTMSDVCYVAENMRQADVAEVYAAAGDSPMSALCKSVEMSDDPVTVASPEGVPLVIFGTVQRSLLTGVGIPWLLGCDEALKHKRGFAKYAPKIVELMLEDYEYLENYVHMKNRVSVRWLKRLGFKMDEPIRFPSGERFIHFSMKR